MNKIADIKNRLMSKYHGLTFGENLSDIKYLIDRTEKMETVLENCQKFFLVRVPEHREYDWLDKITEALTETPEGREMGRFQALKLRRRNDFGEDVGDVFINSNKSYDSCFSIEFESGDNWIDLRLAKKDISKINQALMECEKWIDEDP